MILSQWHNHNHYFKVCNHCCFIIIICQKFLTNFTIYHHAMLLSKHNIANWHGLEYCLRQILSGCVWKLGSTLWVEQGKNCEDIFVFSRCLDLDGRNKQSKDFSATMKLGISNVWKQMKLQRLCIRLNTDKEVSVDAADSWNVYKKISINPEKTQKLKFMLFSSPDLVVRRSPGWSCHVAGIWYAKWTHAIVFQQFLCFIMVTYLWYTL